MEKIIAIGTGGHAKVVIDIMESACNYEIIGVTTKDEDIKEFLGYPVLGNDEVLLDYKNKGVKNIAIGIGGYRNNDLRINIYNRLKSEGFNPIKIVHHSVFIGRGVSIGEGSVIFPGVVINTDAKIRNNVIIATSSSIDHETIIEDNVLISAGVTIGVYSIIKFGALVGLGAKIVSGITIGDNVLVGAGAVVVQDALERGTYLGIPARKINE